MAAQTTSKKVKVIGQQDYINASTGELESFAVTQIEDRDFNFTKVWMRNFLATLDIVGNQKTRLCMWVVDHVNRENMLVGTMRDLAAQSGTSLETVRLTLKILMDADFLRRVSVGVYIVNPDVVYKGTRASRLNVLNQYSTAERVKLSDEEKLANLLASIDQLQAKADKLRKQIAKDKGIIPGQERLAEVTGEDLSA